MVHEIENFFGVYLLFCKNPKFLGHTYIGFTVNPNRRVKQHNTGTQAGGAKRTSGRGPWDMVLIIHGFPNKISALRYEWAWQNPNKSRRLKAVACKRRTENRFQYRLRVCAEMLQTAPWDRLPLTIRWLKQEYLAELLPSPPKHMPLAYGPVEVKSVKPSKSSQDSSSQEDDDFPTLSVKRKCVVCHQKLQSDANTLECVSAECSARCHTLCLAEHFLGSKSDHLLPLDGTCPKCRKEMLWGDLIRYKRGCYQNLQEIQDDSGGDHWTDELAALGTQAAHS